MISSHIIFSENIFKKWGISAKWSMQKVRKRHQEVTKKWLYNVSCKKHWQVRKCYSFAPWKQPPINVYEANLAERAMKKKAAVTRYRDSGLGYFQYTFSGRFMSTNKKNLRWHFLNQQHTDNQKIFYFSLKRLIRVDSFNNHIQIQATL